MIYIVKMKQLIAAYIVSSEQAGTVYAECSKQAMVIYAVCGKETIMLYGDNRMCIQRQKTAVLVFEVSITRYSRICSEANNL